MSFRMLVWWILGDVWLWKQKSWEPCFIEDLKFWRRVLWLFLMIFITIYQWRIVIDWEDVIIFLPPAIDFVFLFAMMSNATELSEWIRYLHKQSCYVVYTDFRPTPLQHYVVRMAESGIVSWLMIMNNFISVRCRILSQNRILFTAKRVQTANQVVGVLKVSMALVIPVFTKL